MYLEKSLKLVLLVFIVFFMVKIVLEIKCKFSLNRQLRFIPSEDVRSVEFKWLGDPLDKIYTVDTFKFPVEKRASVDFEIKKTNSKRFDIFLNKKLLVSRQCFDDYVYTNLGCQASSACENKTKHEYVIDKMNKYIIHKCDGNGDILESYACHSKSDQYDLPFPCGDSNICFDKPDGHILPGTSTHSYKICSNGMPKERLCDVYEEYFDVSMSKCIQAPDVCKQLNKNESYVYKSSLVCFKNENGILNVHPFSNNENIEDNKICHTVKGNCDPYFSHDSAVLVPKLWTTSQFYKKCIGNFWNLHFCDSLGCVAFNRNIILKSLEEAIPESIIYMLPNLDNIKVFDEKHQSCVCFDYTKHFLNNEIPLLLTDPLMENDSKLLPQYFFNWKTQVKSKAPITSAAAKINHTFNNFETIEDFDRSTFNVMDTDMCTNSYNEYKTKKGLSEFLGLITVAYNDTILSCRHGIPVNKLEVNKIDNPQFWGRVKINSNSYRDGQGNVVNCNKSQTLHKYILTCVDHSCTRADYIYPFNYPLNYYTTSVTYNKQYSLCSRNGRNHALKGPVAGSNLLNKLSKYCTKKTGIYVHPYLNIPLSCNKSVDILNSISHRDKRLHTFTMKPNSIFKKDINALNLHFLQGE